MPLQYTDGMGIYKCYGTTPTLRENTGGVGIRQYLIVDAWEYTNALS